MRAELFADAGELSEYPVDGLPEIAVMGRSNVGKSSFINALLGRKQLARTSGKPGKTRRVHFYRIEDAVYLVDLPGYGYAAVSRSERAAWRPMVERYLGAERPCKRGALLLVDARRSLQSEELELLDWLGRAGIPTRLVLTKRDKLKRQELARALSKLQSDTGFPAANLAAISSTKRTGLGEVAAWVREWTDFRLTKPDGGRLS